MILHPTHHVAILGFSRVFDTVPFKARSLGNGTEADRAGVGPPATVSEEPTCARSLAHYSHDPKDPGRDFQHEAPPVQAEPLKVEKRTLPQTSSGLWLPVLP